MSLLDADGDLDVHKDREGEAVDDTLGVPTDDLEGDVDADDDLEFVLDAEVECDSEALLVDETDVDADLDAALVTEPCKDADGELEVFGLRELETVVRGLLGVGRGDALEVVVAEVVLEEVVVPDKELEPVLDFVLDVEPETDSVTAMDLDSRPEFDAELVSDGEGVVDPDALAERVKTDGDALFEEETERVVRGEADDDDETLSVMLDVIDVDGDGVSLVLRDTLGDAEDDEVTEGEADSVLLTDGLTVTEDELEVLGDAEFMEGVTDTEVELETDGERVTPEEEDSLRVLPSERVCDGETEADDETEADLLKRDDNDADRVPVDETVVDGECDAERVTTIDGVSDVDAVELMLSVPLAELDGETEVEGEVRVDGEELGVTRADLVDVNDGVLEVDGDADFVPVMVDVLVFVVDTLPDMDGEPVSEFVTTGVLDEHADTDGERELRGDDDSEVDGEMVSVRRAEAEAEREMVGEEELDGERVTLPDAEEEVVSDNDVDPQLEAVSERVPRELADVVELTETLPVEDELLLVDDDEEIVLVTAPVAETLPVVLGERLARDVTETVDEIETEVEALVETLELKDLRGEVEGNEVANADRELTKENDSLDVALGVLDCVVEALVVGVTPAERVPLALELSLTLVEPDLLLDVEAVVVGVGGGLRVEDADPLSDFVPVEVGDSVRVPTDENETSDDPEASGAAVRVLLVEGLAVVVGDVVSETVPLGLPDGDLVPRSEMDPLGEREDEDVEDTVREIPEDVDGDVLTAGDLVFEVDTDVVGDTVGDLVLVVEVVVDPEIRAVLVEEVVEDSLVETETDLVSRTLRVVVVVPVVVLDDVPDTLGDGVMDGDLVVEADAHVVREAAGERVWLTLAELLRDPTVDPDGLTETRADRVAVLDADTDVVVDGLRVERTDGEPELDTDTDGVVERETRGLRVFAHEIVSRPDAVLETVAVDDAVDVALVHAERDSFADAELDDDVEEDLEVETEGVEEVEVDGERVDVLVVDGVRVTVGDLVDEADVHMVREPAADRVDVAETEGDFVGRADSVALVDSDGDFEGEGDFVDVFDGLSVTEAVIERDERADSEIEPVVVDEIEDEMELRADRLSRGDTELLFEGADERDDVLLVVLVAVAVLHLVETTETVDLAEFVGVEVRNALTVDVDDALVDRVAVLVVEAEKVLMAENVAVTVGLMPTLNAARAAFKGLTRSRCGVDASKPKKERTEVVKSRRGDDNATNAGTGSLTEPTVADKMPITRASSSTYR